jgi:hypothetical protein
MLLPHQDKNVLSLFRDDFRIHGWNTLIEYFKFHFQAVSQGLFLLELAFDGREYRENAIACQ